MSRDWGVLAAKVFYPGSCDLPDTFWVFPNLQLFFCLLLALHALGLISDKGKAGNPMKMGWEESQKQITLFAFWTTEEIKMEGILGDF